jgi:phosphoglycerol transferase MdoB-like AlkP superfamily enzyme
MIFVPFKFVSFSTPGKIRLTKSLSIVYFIFLIILVWNPSSSIAIISLIFPLMYFGYALYLKATDSKALLLTE